MNFADRLASIGYSSYDEYLQSDHWESFKSRCRDSGLRRCAVCGSRNIEFHHQTYDRVGNENTDDVVALCRIHHEAVHQWLKSNGMLVSNTGLAVFALSSIHEKAKVSALVSIHDCPARDKSKKCWFDAARAEVLYLLRNGVMPDYGILLHPKVKNKNFKFVRAILLNARKTKKYKDLVSKDLKASSDAKASGLGVPFSPALKPVELEKRKARGRYMFPGEPRGKKKAAQDVGAPETGRRSFISSEAEKWKDPLYAIKMMGNGHRPFGK